MPGSYLEINVKTFNIKTTKYWDISNTKELDNVSEEDIFDKIDEILEDAIKIRLRSDVGIGAFKWWIRFKFSLCSYKKNLMLVWIHIL